MNIIGNMKSSKSVDINTSIDFAEKPSNSKIKLTKSSSYLSFYIPPKGFDIFSILNVAFVVASTLLFIIQILRSPALFNSFFITFSIPFLAMGCFQIYIVLLSLYSKTYLKIENQTITYTKTFFGAKFNIQKPIVRSEIKKIVFTRKYSGHDRYGNPQKNPAKLQIYAGSKNIILGGSTSEIKHEAEIQWLAHEISNWLDIHLDILDYSPQVPSDKDYPLPISSDIEISYTLTEKTPQTKIAIIKKPDLLSICLPPYGYQLELGGPICVLVGGLVCFSAWRYLFNPVFLTIFIVALLFDLYCIFEYLFLFFGKRYIQIDRQSINYVKMLFGARVSRHHIISRKNLKCLTLVRKNWWKNNGAKNLPTLRISEGSKKIEIGVGVLKREDEITWLASEISEWLNIPIDIVDPVIIDQNLDINNN
jgi:hypothetical protein